MPLKPGNAAKVMTGAPVPEGTGKVIMIEKTSEMDGKIRILSAEKKSNICFKGEDVSKGDVILPALTLLRPLEISNLISAGITEVKVARSLKVSILATGDEIVDSAEKLSPGKIMNSNGPMLAALCCEHGLEVVINTTIRDNLDVTVKAIQQALEKSDVVILSGGVSVGDYDYVADAMTDAGLKIHFNKVAVKPGKPITFASAPSKAVFGLPGNPVSVYLMFHLFVLRAVRLMLGQLPQERLIELPLAEDFQRRNAKRLAYIPSRLTQKGTLEMIQYHGSAHLQALLKSDGFFIVPEGIEKFDKNRKVSFMPIKGIL
jgi:molybdopterin molybdotransferase